MVTAALLLAAALAGEPEQTAEEHLAVDPLPKLDLRLEERVDQLPRWTGPYVTVEQIADPFAKDLAWIGAGAAADLMSTSAALRWCSTCREGNALGWDVEARVSLKLSLAIGAGSGCWALRRAGHGKTATVIRWTLFSVQALATANNAVHAIRGR